MPTGRKNRRVFHISLGFSRFGAILAKRFGIEAARDLAPNHPTLGDVDSPEALEAYQAKKRAYKAQLKAQQQ